MKHLVQENKNLKSAVIVHVPQPALLRKPERDWRRFPPRGAGNGALKSTPCVFPGQAVPFYLQLSVPMCQMTSLG